MEMEIHASYPKEIKNPNGVILGVKLIPSGLPKEGPKPLHESGYPAILFACNTWTQQDAPDVNRWEWFYFRDFDMEKAVDAFVRSQMLNFNQWYYLDVISFEGEEK